MWYAFWMLSLALIAGIIVVYAVRREDKENARGAGPRTPAHPTGQKPEDERGKVVSLQHAAEEKRFSDNNLPPFLREEPTEKPPKVTPVPKKPAVKKAASTKPSTKTTKPAVKKAAPRKKAATKTI